MKKIVVLIISLLITFSLIGCSKKIDSSNFRKLVIKEYEINSSNISNEVIIKDYESIKHIIDNINSLSLKKMSKNEPTQILYELLFYDNNQNIKNIGITALGWLDIDGKFHKIKKGNFDIEYIKLLLSHEHSFTEGLCECGYINRVWLNTNFDLTDRKIFSSVTLEDEFADDLICLTLRHTTTYVILSKEYFGIDCITKVEYLSSEPPSHFYEEGNEHLLASYNQIVFLHITPQSKERIIEIIKELETLEFVRSASPDYKISIGDVRFDN